MRATQRRLWRQCKNRGCPKAGSYRPSLRQGRVRNRHSCRKGNLHAPRHPWFWQRSVPRFCKATYPLAAGRPQKLPLLRQKNYPARQRKAGLPRNLDAEDEKPPMAGLMAAMGGLPMWRAEMTARPNHCFPARPRLCRGRFFDMYPPVVKLRRTFFASFSFFVESNLYEARGASAKLRRRRPRPFRPCAAYAGVKRAYPRLRHTFSPRMGRSSSKHRHWPRRWFSFTNRKAGVENLPRRMGYCFTRSASHSHKKPQLMALNTCSSSRSFSLTSITGFV